MKIEILENAKFKFCNNADNWQGRSREDLQLGWDACRKMMHNKEEIIEHLNHLIMMPSSELDKYTNDEGMITNKWFEQFKK